MIIFAIPNSLYTISDTHISMPLKILYPMRVYTLQGHSVLGGIAPQATSR